MGIENQTSFLGHFTVQGTDHAGALFMDGANSKLEIYSDEFLHLKDEEMTCVRGVSKEGVSISAVYCVPLILSGSASYYDKNKSYMTLRPNYVILGPRYLEPEENVIAAISFTFSEANQLFYDWSTFGRIFRKHRLSFGQLREILRGVRRAPKHRRRGGHLDLYYRWDRGPILEVGCDVGKITVWNATGGKFPSPDGLDVRNRVRITCAFSTPVNLEAALLVQRQMMSLFELAAQARQNVDDITLEHTGAPDETPLILRMIHEEREKVDMLMPTDALLNGGLHEEEFTTVLTRWMDTSSDRRAARQRFMDGFRRGYSYKTDRLIGAANAFDLLPSTDFSKHGALPAEVESLIAELEDRVKAAAKDNPAINDHKERLLNNLGLVRGLNLRNKVLQRWATVPSCIASKLPEMENAIAHSVHARNFFVHGSEVKMSAQAVYDLAPFFTDTLEFVFGISELCHCGWDADRWAKDGYSLSRYKWYMSQFPTYMERLKAALEGKLPS
jgi:ApeA N-terminal domain 1